MFESSDMQRSVDRIQQHMELRGLRPNTVSTFGGCAHRFLAHVGKRPVDIALLRTRTFSLRVRKSGILEIIEVLGSRGDFCRMTPAIPPAPHTRRAYDHCLRDHVVRCGAKTVARHVQIPRSTVST